MKGLITLISGRGSNLQALISQSLEQRWPIEHRCVISNRPDAPGLMYARSANIPVLVIDHSQYAQREDFDDALAKALDSYAPDVIALAGFMRVLTPKFCARFEGRLINVHPSLLPSFPGLNTHQRALAEGVKVHGCTIHAVTADLDHGPILAQAVVPVLPGDTSQSLAGRVLEMEHRVFPSSVAAALSGRKSYVSGAWIDGPPEFEHPYSECLAHPLLQPA